ncbi:DUF3040 domain-containing protein [Kitasatospora sp. NPDC005751]|uniref:DUF3040 domain-containing protein n=1 Tax=Kitasatospora sp. NPDC005751 TaxID=3157064 RepID=UPI0033CCB106
MRTPLTGREQRLLDGIESHLRREDPALERLLAVPPGLRTRLWHRPRFLAAAASALAAPTAACALLAGSGAATTPVAEAGAGGSAPVLPLVFRRLTLLRAG